MFFKGEDIAIDLGTASVLVYVKKNGIVLNEPSVVAIDNNTKKVIAVGESAREMLGKTPGNIVAIRPLRDGVIADYNVTEKMLKYFIDKAVGKRSFFKPRVMVCIPSGVTSVEERAVKQAALAAGAKSAYLIEEPVAAALGAGIDISEPHGSMVVDIGGGTSEVAVISLGGIVTSTSLRVAGDEIDSYIVGYVKKEYNLAIGDRTAEEIKISIGCAFPKETEESLDIRGRDLISGLPKTITITSTEILEAIAEPIAAIIDSIKQTLESIPPELAADIMEYGITLTGGGALLSGLDKLITQETGMPVNIANEPLNCVALGTGMVLEHIETLKTVLLSPRKLRM